MGPPERDPLPEAREEQAGQVGSSEDRERPQTHVRRGVRAGSVELPGHGGAGTRGALLGECGHVHVTRVRAGKRRRFRRTYGVAPPGSPLLRRVYRQGEGETPAPDRLPQAEGGLCRHTLCQRGGGGRRR